MDKGAVADNDRCAVRQQNKLGFYSRVLMSKWVAARTKVKAVAGDDSDQTAGSVRAAQIFADVIEPIVFGTVPAAAKKV